jgi:hypothetical protein
MTPWEITKTIIGGLRGKIVLSVERELFGGVTMNAPSHGQVELFR